MTNAVKTLKKLQEELDAPETALAKKALPTHDLGLGATEVPDHLSDSRGALDKGASAQSKSDLPTHKVAEEKKEDEDKLDEVSMVAAPAVDGEKAADEAVHAAVDASHGEKLPAEPCHLSPAELEKALKEEEEKEDEKEKDDMKEHITKLLASEENLSEELKLKTVTIFEAAVHASVTNQVKRIKKVYEGKLQEETAKISSALIEQIDMYLSALAEEWLQENKLAVESGLHAALAEGLLHDMKSVILKHNVELPVEKVDLFSKLSEKHETLEGQLNAEIEKNIELRNQLKESEKSECIKDLCEGLAETEVEKFKTLAEGLDFENREGFAKKLHTVKDSYFPKAPVASGVGVDVIVDGGIEIEDSSNSIIKAAANEITRQVAKK